MELVLSFHDQENFACRDGLAHLLVIQLFQFGLLHFQTLDFLYGGRVILVSGIGGRGVALELEDGFLQAPLFLLHLMEEGEEELALALCQVGLFSNEFFQVGAELLRVEFLLTWLCKYVGQCGHQNQDGASGSS